MAEAFREKRLWLGILALALALTMVICRTRQHTFSTQTWLSEPEKRASMVDGLFATHSLEGRPIHAITALLGEPDGESGDTLIYELGPEAGLISIDEAFLLISLSPDGTAISAGVYTS